MKRNVKLLILLLVFCLSGCAPTANQPHPVPPESQTLEARGGLVDTTPPTTEPPATTPPTTVPPEPQTPETTSPAETPNPTEGQVLESQVGLADTTPPTTEPPATTPPATVPPEPQTPETTSPVETPVPVEPEDDDFVRVRDYIPTIYIALAYATEDNFTGQRIYDFTEPWLRYGTVKKLIPVQAELRTRNLSLKIWDAFRPTAAQFKLWEVYPDSTYVANPIDGFSSHSRGNTVDITLVDEAGREIPMPTGFDDFSKLADRDYSDCTPEAAENALLLERTMKKHGFKPYSGEWWHFRDKDRYPVEQDFLPAEAAWYYADCKEYIHLRTAPSSRGDAITQIPANESFQVLAWYKDFAYVAYQGLQGYVLGAYIRQA